MIGEGEEADLPRRADMCLNEVTRHWYLDLHFRPFEGVSLCKANDLLL